MAIRASAGRSLLVALLAGGAVRALVLCELPAAALAGATLLVFTVAARDLLSARHPGTLALDADGRWHLDAPGRERFTGRLADAGYRSAMLIALELEREHVSPSGWRRRLASVVTGGLVPARERRRLTIFVDGVDAADFSFLHLQLAHPEAAAGAPR